MSNGVKPPLVAKSPNASTSSSVTPSNSGGLTFFFYHSVSF